MNDPADPGMARAADARTGADPVADGFEPYFRRHIEPRLQSVEITRLARKALIAQRLRLFGFAALAILVLTWQANAMFAELHGLVGILLPILIAVGVFVWAVSPGDDYTRRYQQIVLPAVARYFGDFTYDAAGGIDRDDLERSALVPPLADYYYEDLFKGRYKGVEVAFCEGRLCVDQQVGRERQTVTIFDGVLMLVTMNKPFRGRTVVRHDSGSMQNWIRNETAGALQRVVLEDPEFEKQFEVYATDQTEARYLLTPAFMDRLMVLMNTLNTIHVEAAFFDKRLLLKIHKPGKDNANLFEPGDVDLSAYDVSGLKRTVAEFEMILSIVDELKLHEQSRL